MGIIVRQSIKGTAVNYVGVFVGFFTTFFVLTRYLTAEEIGLTRVLVDAATLFAGLAQVGTASSIIRYYPYFKDERSADHGFFFWTLVVPMLGFGVFGAAFWLLRDVVCSAFSEKSDLFVMYYKCVFPLAFALLYMTVAESNANVLMRIVVPKFVREVLVRVLTLAVYLLYASGVLGFDGFVYAFCGVYAAALLVDVVYLLSLGRVSFRPDWSFVTRQLGRDYLLYTLFLLTSTLSSVLAPFANSFFISAKMGLAYTGVFAIAGYITALVEIPYRSLGAIAQPQLSAAVKDGDISSANVLCRKIAASQLLVGGFIFLLIWANLDLLFRLLPNGGEYAAAKWVVFILGLSKLYTSVFSIGVSVLNYSRFYYYSLIFSAIFTLFSICFNNLFIPWWGINGAALATLVSSVIYLGGLLALNRAKMRTSPFSASLVRIAALLLFLAAADALWRHFLLPDSDALWARLAESAVRSAVLVLLGAAAVLRLSLSDDMRRLLENFLTKIKIKIQDKEQ